MSIFAFKVGWNEPETGLDVPEKAVKKEDCGDDFREIELMKLMKSRESFACKGKDMYIYAFYPLVVMRM